MAKDELIPVNPGEQEIVKKFERLLGRKLKQVSEINPGTRGYVVNQAGAV